MSTVYAMGLPVKKKDGDCAHPSCPNNVDFSKHEKPPAGWGNITFQRYTKEGAGRHETLLVCPNHTLAFTNRQQKLTSAVRRLIRVVIESPFAGNWDKNLAYLRAAMHDCLIRGEAPYASHALYTQPGVLDDDKPEERKLGMEAGFTWGEVAQKVVIYTDLGISGGMRDGIERAGARGQIVEHRQLEGVWRDEAKSRNIEHDR